MAFTTIDYKVEEGKSLISLGVAVVSGAFTSLFAGFVALLVSGQFNPTAIAAQIKGGFASAWFPVYLFFVLIIFFGFSMRHLGLKKLRAITEQM